MKRMFVFFVLYITLLFSVNANIMKVTFVMDTWDNVDLLSIKYSDGGAVSKFQKNNGTYKLAIYGTDGKLLDESDFNADFWLYSDPPVKENTTIISKQFYYNPDFYELKVVNSNGDVIFTHFLQGYGNDCVIDGSCGISENFASCPSDCNITNDKLCSPFTDGICDEICAESRITDPDCNIVLPTECSDAPNGKCDYNCLNLGLNDPDCFDSTTNDDNSFVLRCLIPFVVLFVLGFIFLSLYLLYLAYQKFVQQKSKPATKLKRKSSRKN